MLWWEKLLVGALVLAVIVTILLYSGVLQQSPITP